MKDYYKILEITTTANNQAIRKAWLKKALEYHPDHNPGNILAEEHLKEAQEAYRILSDNFLKSQYDAGLFKLTGNDFPFNKPVTHYFYAEAAHIRVKQFEELSISFTYSGEGRIFKRPSFDGFHLTGSPFVDVRMIVHEGQLIKETTLTYIVCPLPASDHKIGPASIRIYGTIYYTSPINIIVEKNNCFFLENQVADGKPYKYTMHYEFKNGEAPLRISESKKNHILLIPRSRTAYIFHSIGSTMKVVFTIWGAIMFNYYFDWNIFLGALAGSLLGGINVQLMYWLVKMKSKYRHAPKYPLVNDYIERGYFWGESAGIPLLKINVLYLIGRVLI